MTDDFQKRFAQIRAKRQKSVTADQPIVSRRQSSMTVGADQARPAEPWIYYFFTSVSGFVISLGFLYCLLLIMNHQESLLGLYKALGPVWSIILVLVLAVVPATRQHARKKSYFERGLDKTTAEALEKKENQEFNLVFDLQWFLIYIAPPSLKRPTQWLLKHRLWLSAVIVHLLFFIWISTA